MISEKGLFVTSFTIKGNSVLQTSALKIVLEYAHSFEQHSTNHPNRRPVCKSVRYQRRLGQVTDKHIQALIVELYSYSVNMSQVS